MHKTILIIPEPKKDLPGKLKSGNAYFTNGIRKTIKNRPKQTIPKYLYGFNKCNK